MAHSYSVGKIIRNIGWSFFGGISLGVAGFIGSVFVSRNFSVVDYGILQLATTYFLFFQLLENLTHPNVMRIEMLKISEDDKLSLLPSSSQIMFFVYLMASIGLFSVYLYTQSILILYIAIMTSGQMLRLGIGISCFFDVHLEAKKTQLSQTIGAVSECGYRILTSFNGQVLWQAFGILVKNASMLIVQVLFLGKDIARISFIKMDFDKISFLLRRSISMLPIAVLSMLIYKLDILILGFFNQNEQISFYSNAVKFAEPWSFVSVGIVNSLLPNIMSKKAIGANAYYRQIRKMFTLLFVSAVGIALFFTIFSEVIVTLTYGDRYINSISLLKISIWGNIFLFFMVGQQIWEISENLQRFVVLKLFLAVILNLVLNLITIPYWGALACAVNSIITYFFVAIGFNFAHKKARFLNKQIFRSLFEVKSLSRSAMSWRRP